FGGIGGEDKADSPLELRRGAVGPGRLLEQVMGDGSQVVTTIICGDNYAVENLEEVGAGQVELNRVVAKHRGQIERLDVDRKLVVAQANDVLAVDEQFLAIRFGDQSGTLSATLANLLKAEHQAAMQVSIRLRQTMFYITITVTILILMLSFMMIKIVPSFQAIFDDFELELPSLTILLISISNFAVNYWYLIALVLLAVVWVFRAETSRRFFRRVLSSRVVPTVVALRSADLLDMLSVTLRSGRPLAGALSTLARHHFDSFIRHKLLFVRNEVEQGADVWHSMATARLITPAEAQALESSTSVDSRAWTLVRLARLKRNRVAGQIDIGVNLLQPLITLMLAGTVLFIA
ncbi:MAG: type II secretion system F family protein, partial [Planctomycetes bacterium]|nr:type II secretion system F family protein [Planctomycetota bacterium]